MCHHETGMEKKKKLSPVEIEAAVNGIRKKYHDYMIEFLKPPAAEYRFEDRYIEALKARIDLDRFILDEIRLVEKLIEDEKEKKRLDEQQKAARYEQRKRKKTKHVSFVDRIFEENRERIRKYMKFGLEDDDVYEIDKLYGAVKEFEITYWSPVEKILKKLYTSRYSGPRRELEERLFDITLEGPGGYPPGLVKLRTLLDRYPREYTVLQRESQRCMLDVSFFLHFLRGELYKLRNDDVLDNAERETVEKSIRFVHTVIEDFRLTDLNDSKLKRGK